MVSEGVQVAGNGSHGPALAVHSALHLLQPHLQLLTSKVSLPKPLTKHAVLYLYSRILKFMRQYMHQCMCIYMQDEKA